MAMTKQRKLILGVLGAAVAALGAERTFFRPSDAAAAANAEDYLVGASTETEVPSDNAAVASMPASPGSTIAARLQAVATSQQLAGSEVPDAFEPAWYVPKPPPAPEAPSAAPAVPSAQVEFARKHRLTAVMGSGPKGYAIVDGKCLPLGHVLDGFQLVSIANRSATFQSAAGEVELKVDAEAVTGQADAAAAASGPSPQSR